MYMNLDCSPLKRWSP